MLPYLNVGTAEEKAGFLGVCQYRSGGYDSAEGFGAAVGDLSAKEAELSHTGIHNRLFYLATPPSVFLDASASIKAAAMSPTGWTRVVVEKPFGRDSASSLELSRGLAEHLTEDQVRGCAPAACLRLHGDHVQTRWLLGRCAIVWRGGRASLSLS